MLRFIAYAWDANSPSQSDAAQTFRHRTAHDAHLRLRVCGSGPGGICRGFLPGAVECYDLENRAGVVLGTLFSDDSEPDVRGAAATRLNRSATARIVGTEARDLVQRYSGTFVAFICDAAGGRTWVLQEPSAVLSIYRTKVQGVLVYFSDQADCSRLTGARFKVNWDYVAAHAVMPIQRTGVTALDGICEILGGQCDEIANGNVATRAYWQPSNFALCRIEDATQAAIEFLPRHDADSAPVGQLLLQLAALALGRV